MIAKLRQVGLMIAKLRQVESVTSYPMSIFLGLYGLSQDLSSLTNECVEP